MSQPEVLKNIKVNLNPILNNINLPTVIKTAILPNTDNESIFVATQIGQILRIEETISTIFLDIRDKIIQLGINNGKYDERGLIGLEFHPNFISNGIFWIYYSINDTSGKSVPVIKVDPSNIESLHQTWNNRDEYYDHINVLEEWKYISMDNILLRRTILKIKHPFYNNNGINNLSYSDEYECLILGTGDGGFEYDPFNLSQDDNSLFGKLIAIDISRIKNSDSDIKPVTYVHELKEQHGTCITILSKGLRNPGKLVFDKDIKYQINTGQNSIESIYAFRNYNKNFGWRSWEGIFPTLTLIPCKNKDSNLNYIIIWDRENFDENGSGDSITIKINKPIHFISKDNFIHSIIESDSNWIPLECPSFYVPYSYPLLAKLEFNTPGKYYIIDKNNNDIMRLEIIVTDIIGNIYENSNCNKLVKVHILRNEYECITFPFETFSNSNFRKPVLTTYHREHRFDKIRTSYITGAEIYKGTNIPELQNTLICIGWSDIIFNGNVSGNGVLFYSKIDPNNLDKNHDHYKIDIPYQNGEFFVTLGSNKNKDRLFLGTYKSFGVLDHNKGCIYEINRFDESNSSNINILDNIINSNYNFHKQCDLLCLDYGHHGHANHYCDEECDYYLYHDKYIPSDTSDIEFCDYTQIRESSINKFNPKYNDNFNSEFTS